ncbi:formate dehydrogenase accessory sulfurtransferase FdhD [Oceanimonas sp. NS1]|nr:formate dehydrogenase accessory sulfurtransferase FdhD [Oceanimonas sp. NS1]
MRAGISGAGGARAPRPVPNPVTGPGLGRALLRQLNDWQPLGQECGALHAAFYANAEGSIVHSCEDVGRHNALDKLLGWHHRHGPGQPGMVLITSRCSIELVQKMVRAGQPTLITLGAPTELAVHQAKGAGLNLLHLTRRQGPVFIPYPAITQCHDQENQQLQGRRRRLGRPRVHHPLRAGQQKTRRQHSQPAARQQGKGFDCPGCAWGDEQGKHFSFCENGAKAISWEATARRVTPAFFKQHAVSRLRRQSDYFLEYQGRIEQPMYLNRDTDHYEPISWDDAFALIGRHLNRLDHADQLELYTSGRASNEAAYLYQLFGRAFGTNNFPDCSNLCHEASGVALTRAIGVGKGTVTLQDFDQADAIFVFGQNPGTNHPRMLHSLRNAARRGTAIVTFNNLKERGLERFADPQSPVEMLTPKDSRISSHYFCPRLGGDMAAVRGMVKLLLEWDAEALTKGEPGLLDRQFIAQHTQGLDDYMAQVAATPGSTLSNSRA